MSKELFTNIVNYSRLIIRRDRIHILIWIIAIALFTVIVPPALAELLPTEQDRIMMAETMSNPAMIAMVGPGYGFDDYTVGAMSGHQMLLFSALAAAIMSILLVSRHTRGDEERGRIEMLRALPVGRLSNIGSTISVLFGSNVLLAIITGFGLYALGIESMGFKGSIIYGAALGVTGIFFTAITALFAQLSQNSRGTIGYSFAFLGLAYLMRAIGDVSSEFLSMLSPLGWILRTQVYVNNYWWPILLTLAGSLVITTIAFYLNSIRDLGAGFIRSKPGRKNASPFLRNPLGLGLKLQRTAIIAWAIAMFVLGASYGSVFGDMESFFETNEMYQQLLGTVEGFSLTEQFLSLLMSVISMICTIPAILMVLKIKSEENKNRTEHLLARSVSRTRIMGSFLTISIFVGFIMLLFAATGLWSAATPVMDEPIPYNIVLKAALVYLPAMLIMIGIVTTLVGVKTRVTSLAWIYLAYSFFVVYLGGVLQTPEWMAKITPYGNIPKIPIEDMNYFKVTVMTAIALMFIVGGFIGYNKRDIQG